MLRYISVLAAALILSACSSDSTAPEEAVSTILIAPPSATTLRVGDQLTLSATARGASGQVLTARALTWTSSSAAVLAVNASGVVTAVSPGAATATASVGQVRATVDFQILAPVAAIQMNTPLVQLEPDSTRTLVPVIRDAAGNVLAGRLVTWQTSDPAIVRVNAAGLITAVTPGTATITATSEGRTASTQITVLTRGISQAVNVIDSTKLVLVADSAAQSTGVFTFTLADTSNTLPVSTGQVLVGAAQGGFLRRVTSVERSGNRLVARTTDAALNDIVRDGALNVQVPLSITAPVPAPSYGATANFAGPARIISRVPLTVANGEIRLGAFDVFNNNGSFLKFTDGVVRFDPTFVFNTAFANQRIETVNTSVGGSVTFNGDIEFAAQAALNREAERELFRVEKPFFTSIPTGSLPIPVVGKVTLKFKAVAALSFQATHSGTAAFASNATMLVGANYTRAGNAGWTNTSTAQAAFTQPRPLSVQERVQGAVTTKLVVETDVELYRAATGTLSASAAATGERTVNLTANSRTDVCTGAIDAAASVAVRVLGVTLAEYAGSRELARREFCRRETALRRPAVLSGRVYDATNNAALANVAIAIRESGALVTTVQSNAQGAYTASVLDSGTYSITAAASGYTSATITSQVVRGPTTALPIPMVPASTVPGAISGRIINASTNGAIPNATVELRAGINTAAGTIVATVMSSATGAYSFANLPAGVYSVRAAATNFVTGIRTGIVVGGSTVPSQDVALSPVGSVAAVRVVLTWGASPSDLDSHLTGPIAGSASRFHVFYANRGGCNSAPFACLDVDDISSFGPETITISQLFDGVYRYSVQNFSASGNGGNATSTTLASSNARVEVYVNNALRETFSVPQQAGTLWTVFSMDRSGNIVPINTVTGNAPPAIRIGGTGGNSATTDADVIAADRKPKGSP